jgi:hypothetical protein
MFTMKSTQMKVLQTAMESYARCVVESVAENEGFNAVSALEAVGFPSVVVSKSVSKTSRVLLPWCGSVDTSCCSGIRVNHGLYTQCTREKDGEYCSTCSKNGGPKHGDISSRCSDDFEHASKVVKYSKVMEKLGISREEAEAAASAAGVTISETDFEKVSGGRRGRPRKLVDTSSSDSDGEPKKRGRPKKQKTVVARSAGDDLIASLMANAVSASDSDSSVASSEEKAVVKAAKATEKAAKLAAKATEKAAKAEQQATEKAAKAEKQSVEKAAKAEKQATEKAAKLAEKLASKAAEKAVKDAAKEVLKLEMAAAKAAEKAAKAEKQSAEKAAEKAVKAEKQSAAKAAEKAAKAEKQAAEKAAKAEKQSAEKAVKLAEKEAAKAEKIAATSLLKLEAAAEEILKAEDAKLEVASDGESSEVEVEEESEVEESEVEENEVEENEVEVEEFTWLEVDYILNPSTGEMYDKTVFEETGEGESVGTYSGGEVTFL